MTGEVGGGIEVYNTSFRSREWLKRDTREDESSRWEQCQARKEKG